MSPVWFTTRATGVMVGSIWFTWGIAMGVIVCSISLTGIRGRSALDLEKLLGERVGQEV